MPSKRISKDLNKGAYFLTFTIKHWYYLFDRHGRWEILREALEYNQKNKGLEVHHYVFMLNHLHLIISSLDVIGFVRDFKQFTSRAFRKNLEKTEPRVLSLFLHEKGGFEFWEKNNMPLFLETQDFYLQKASYIEENPVRKDYVSHPEHWVYSSAHKLSPILAESLV